MKDNKVMIDTKVYIKYLKLREYYLSLYDSYNELYGEYERMKEKVRELQEELKKRKYREYLPRFPEA